MAGRPGVIAYKFLADGRVGPFSHVTWPPEGEWLEATGGDRACSARVHACRLEDLPEWMDHELWRVELDGDVRVDCGKLVADRGRLARARRRVGSRAHGRVRRSLHAARPRRRADAPGAGRRPRHARGLRDRRAGRGRGRGAARRSRSRRGARGRLRRRRRPSRDRRPRRSRPPRRPTPRSTASSPPTPPRSPRTTSTAVPRERAWQAAWLAAPARRGVARSADQATAQTWR